MTSGTQSDDLYAASKDYYNRNAGSYEASSWYFLNRYKDAMVTREIRTCLALIGTREKLKVLEFGPGTGYLLSKLARYSTSPIQFTGFEHSLEMQTIIKERWMKSCECMTFHDSVTESALERIKGQQRFDLVIGSSILHHLPDYEGVVRNGALLLERGGVMYFVREPLHRTECLQDGVVCRMTDCCYRTIGRLLLSPGVKRVLWPRKTKAEDSEIVGVHMYKDGISTLPFRALEQDGFSIAFFRKYNRRPSSMLSRCDNSWLRTFRRDVFGNTLFAIGIVRLT